MKICPKCGFSMMLHKDEKDSYWKCTNCEHTINYKEKSENSAVKYLFNIVLAVIIAGLCILCFHFNAKVQTLTKKNDYLTERVHYKEYNDLEILPCPYCKNEAELYDVGTYYKQYFVECAHCNFKTCVYDTVQGAIDAWNENNSRQN